MLNGRNFLKKKRDSSTRLLAHTSLSLCETRRTTFRGGEEWGLLDSRVVVWYHGTFESGGVLSSSYVRSRYNYDSTIVVMMIIRIMILLSTEYKLPSQNPISSHHKINSRSTGPFYVKTDNSFFKIVVCQTIRISGNCGWRRKVRKSRLHFPHHSTVVR